MADGEWTAEMVADRFAEAVRTWRLLPLSERQSHDFACMETMDASCARPSVERRTPPPPPAAITRLERAIVWSTWLQPEERQLVWSRAGRVPWKLIGAEFGCDRTTAWRRWQLALTKIAGRMNA